jgi:predicted GNAT family acetyltransferase
VGPFLTPITRKFAPPEGCLLLAYDPDTPEKVIGCAGYERISPDICGASRIVVAWPYQKHGVGRHLVAELISQAAAAGYHTMRVRVPRAVPALTSFLLKLGFQEESAPPGQSLEATLVRSLTEAGSATDGRDGPGGGIRTAGIKIGGEQVNERSSL